MVWIRIKRIGSLLLSFTIRSSIVFLNVCYKGYSTEPLVFLFPCYFTLIGLFLYMFVKVDLYVVTDLKTSLKQMIYQLFSVSTLTT